MTSRIGTNYQRALVVSPIKEEATSNAHIEHCVFMERMQALFIEKSFKAQITAYDLFHCSRLDPETRNLFIPRERLWDLVDHLPERLKLEFPLSGVAAFKVGDESLVQACHSPIPTEFIADRPFNALSIGKLFTAVAVMQLIEENKFSLNAPICDLLTADELDLPLGSPYREEKPTKEDLENFKNYGRITIEHLLTHTAGFVPKPASEIEGESWSEKKVGRYHYSNYGFQLLARIIGKYSGQRGSSDHEVGFRNHIEQRIFMPADMEGAIREIHHPYRNRKLDCFEVSEQGTLIKVTAKEPYPHGNGCWSMEACDLMAFEKAVRHHVLIKQESLQLMLTHEPPLAFMVECDPKTKHITDCGHPGSGIGISAFMWTWLTNPPFSAVVLSNYSTGAKVKLILDNIFKAQKID